MIQSSNSSVLLMLLLLLHEVQLKEWRCSMAVTLHQWQYCLTTVASKLALLTLSLCTGLLEACALLSAGESAPHVALCDGRPDAQLPAGQGPDSPNHWGDH